MENLFSHPPTRDSDLPLPQSPTTFDIGQWESPRDLLETLSALLEYPHLWWPQVLKKEEDSHLLIEGSSLLEESYESATLHRELAKIRLASSLQENPEELSSGNPPQQEQRDESQKLPDGVVVTFEFTDHLSGRSAETSIALVSQAFPDSTTIVGQTQGSLPRFQGQGDLREEDWRDLLTSFARFISATPVKISERMSR